MLTGLFASAMQKPNVIIINVDNHSKSHLSCYGNRLNETPTIDRLYDEGMSFEEYQCASRCSASRSALLSGKYHQRFGSIGTGDAREIMKAGEVTMIDYFNANGYKTAMFGKWHNGYNYPFRPEDRGFHEVVEKGRAKDRSETGKMAMKHMYRHNGKLEAYEGFRTDIWFQETNKFIKANRDKPFFIYIPTWSTHGPNFGPKEILQKYQAKAKALGIESNKENDNLLNIGAELESLDRNIAKTIDLLKELDLYENTIFIYMADGPGAKAPKDFNPKKVQGSHIPFILHWAGGKVKVGNREETLVANIDVLPTLIDLCDLSSNGVFKEEGFDGQSTAAMIKEGFKTWQPRTYVSDHQSSRTSREWGIVPLDRTTIHTPKGIFSWKKGKMKAGSSPELSEYAKNEWKKWWDSVSQDFPKFNYTVVGTKHENPSEIGGGYTLVDEFAGSGEKEYFAVEFANEGLYRIGTTSSKKGKVIIDGKAHEGTLPLEISIKKGQYLIYVDTGSGKGAGSLVIEKI